jgi:NurA domain
VCDICTGAHACALRGLNDAHLIGRGLDRWDRSGLFRVRSNVHDPYYGIHRVYFFLLATGDEFARVEIPEWVARDQEMLNLLHAVLVDQCAKGFGYPAVLARADDRAVISLGDRSVLDTLVQQELARRGVVARPSAKLSRKQVRTV